MPMPMHMHDKATQATPVGVICSGRPRSYHNASGVMQRIPGGCITWAGYIIWAGFITWASCRNSNISTVIPPIDHFVRVAGFDGNFMLQQGWYNKGRVHATDNIAKRADAAPPAISPRCTSDAFLQTITAIHLCYHPRCAHGFRCIGADYHQQGRDTGRVLYAPRLQIVATLPALVLLVVRRQRGGLPHQAAPEGR